MKLSQMFKQDIQPIITLLFSVVVMPLLFGYLWHNVYIVNVPFGIADLDNSGLSRSIITQLESSPSLNVCYFTQSEEDLKTTIKNGEVAAGIIIPPNFSKDLSQKLSPKVMILANGTNLSLCGPAVSAASTVLSTISSGMQIKMLEGGGLDPSTASTSLGTFSFAERTLYDPINGYLTKMIYFIIPMTIMAIFVTRFFLPLMLEKRNAFIQHKGRKETLANITEIAGRVAIVSLVGIVASLVSLFLLAIVYDLPLRGDLIIYFVSMAAVMLNFIGFGMMLLIVVKKAENLKFVFHIFAMTTSVHAFLSGVTSPFYLMPKPLVVLAKMFLPLTNLATELKALNLKSIGWDVALPAIGNSLIYSVLWLIIGIAVYALNIRKERRKALQSDSFTALTADTQL